MSMVLPTEVTTVSKAWLDQKFLMIGAGKIGIGVQSAK